ncbi:LOW QUALITY PROTEIN: UDP-glucuronosyltransferase 2B31-like [Meriones unguiculatus]|uniref:LOW QUALITY PROTEIN: UDP-glucuronosyltransferase 2B31-like n=1 Tax=Meriones unguiculatus TaxID=10047 RepID=UPI00293E6B0D|nr:LOW QUALITY PROTEIN: UDP-glucuronosyltransferase 2B31-like [Meriones unguiculatus]
MSVKMTAALLLLLLQLSVFFESGNSGKVLVWPMEFSHWLNLKTILDELVKKGHEVTVLIPLISSQYLLILSYKAENTSAIEFETFPQSYPMADIEKFFLESINKYLYELPKQSFWGYFPMLLELTLAESEYSESLCKDVVFNKEFMTKLQNSSFDVVLADPFLPCGDLLAEILKTPLVYSLRFFFGSTYERYSGGLPLPRSCVPVVLSELTDRMTFTERVKNVIYMIYFDFWFQTFYEKRWNQIYSEVLGRPTTLTETMGKADIWLIRTYWDLEFPHPVLPNFDFVGGLHCRPAKPLPKEIEEFVESSGEHGVVVFSLGSMVANLTEERANVMAAGLAQIPQKVLWRFEGKKPDTLGSNTRLYKWIPQNDLLGHPKTRAFTTHGGTNCIYEAIYHGIPVIGIPLFADQYDNIVHMKAKGAAVRLDFLTMSSTDLLNALRTVTNDPPYKRNAMRLSRIHHDQPVKPLDRAVFWVEYVMRHKGAKHLRPAVHDLSWVQYHSLDVIGFLLACVVTVIFVITRYCLFCCQKFAKAGKKEKKQ